MKEQIHGKKVFSLCEDRDCTEYVVPDGIEVIGKKAFKY